MVIQNGLTKIKTVIISNLRQYFNNTSNYAHLLPSQITAEIFKEMNIYDTNPEQLETFPMVVISGSNGRMITGGISGDFASEVYDENGDIEGYLYGGMYEFSIEVEVGTKSTLEREVLMDLVSSALRFSVRRNIERQGVLIKEMSYGGENKIPYTSDFIYTSTLNLQTFSEWYDYHKLLPITEVGVNLDVETVENKYPRSYSNHQFSL